MTTLLPDFIWLRAYSERLDFREATLNAVAPAAFQPTFLSIR
ncbi:hypothetical protein [Pengzhenrongella frigida]|nr:hypothetical protein [Cellulomonas sp. HLT2-17]